MHTRKRRLFRRLRHLRPPFTAALQKIIMQALADWAGIEVDLADD